MVNAPRIIFASVLFLLSVSSRSQPVTPVPVASGFDSPLAIEQPADGSGDLYIAERGGRIMKVSQGALLAEPFLDITDRISCCMERGLLGLVFHPDYASNGYFYVNYTDVNFNTTVSRFQVGTDPHVADADSETVLLSVDQPFANHNGGGLVFGPDGHLYIGLGDGGAGGDPRNNAQNPGILLGKMLRIDVDAGNPYAVPADNPFVDNNAYLPEIWATGLRNPFRYSFDRLTGDLYIADVGQDLVEEINVQRAHTPAGKNYGWRLMEGSRCFNPASDCNDGSLALPGFDYNHEGERCSVTGGYVYRGSAVPALFGHYLFGDFCTGEIFAAQFSETTGWTWDVLLVTGFLISSFGEDTAGELYVADLRGSVYRLAPAVTISPASGTYLSSQLVDFSLIVQKAVAIDKLDVRLNGFDISRGASNCFRSGQLADGGSSRRCPGIPLSLLGRGEHTLHVTVDFIDGSSTATTVTWTVLGNAEF